MCHTRVRSWFGFVPETNKTTAGARARGARSKGGRQWPADIYSDVIILHSPRLGAHGLFENLSKSDASPYKSLGVIPAVCFFVNSCRPFCAPTSRYSLCQRENGHPSHRSLIWTAKRLIVSRNRPMTLLLRFRTLLTQTFVETSTSLDHHHRQRTRANSCCTQKYPEVLLDYSYMS